MNLYPAPLGRYAANELRRTGQGETRKRRGALSREREALYR